MYGNVCVVLTKSGAEKLGIDWWQWLMVLSLLCIHQISEEKVGRERDEMRSSLGDSAVCLFEWWTLKRSKTLSFHFASFLIHFLLSFSLLQISNLTAFDCQPKRKKKTKSRCHFYDQGVLYHHHFVDVTENCRAKAEFCTSSSCVDYSLVLVSTSLTVPNQIYF